MGARSAFDHGFYKDEDEKTKWFSSLDPVLGLPKRDDCYKANYDRSMSHKVIAMKTEGERRIEVGRDYKYPAMRMGECYLLEHEREAQTNNASIAIVSM